MIRLPILETNIYLKYDSIFAHHCIEVTFVIEWKGCTAVTKPILDIVHVIRMDTCKDQVYLNSWYEANIKR